MTLTVNLRQAMVMTHTYGKIKVKLRGQLVRKCGNRRMDGHDRSRQRPRYAALTEEYTERRSRRRVTLADRWSGEFLATDCAVFELPKNRVVLSETRRTDSGGGCFGRIANPLPPIKGSRSALSFPSGVRSGVPVAQRFFCTLRSPGSLFCYVIKGTI